MNAAVIGKKKGLSDFHKRPNCYSQRTKSDFQNDMANQVLMFHYGLYLLAVGKGVGQKSLSTSQSLNDQGIKMRSEKKFSHQVCTNKRATMAKIANSFKGKERMHYNTYTIFCIQVLCPVTMLINVHHQKHL